ncbi:MAG: menaquinone biosynthetic enzyme MqnA/MqnD family protein [Gemmatimonadota bacterium]
MRKPSAPIRLGHIAYSNCVPVHARLLGREPHAGVEVVRGTPADLNRALAAGEVDVAPASSIEFARHPKRYRVLRGLSISSRGPVRTIVLAARAPMRELDERVVAVPTASATSVVLLRALLEVRERVRPRYVWFRQEAEDPFAAGAAAALYIGDIAAAAGRRARPRAYDLGSEWTQWTGLPFVFALWQTWLGADRDADLDALREILIASRDAALARVVALAAEHATALGWEAAALASYWRSLDYGLDASLLAGLDAFYRLAAEIGEISRVPELRFVPSPV